MAESDDKPGIETAAHLAVRNVPMLDGALTTAQARTRLAETAFDAVDAVLVLDGAGRYAATWPVSSRWALRTAMPSTIRRSSAPGTDCPGFW